MLPSRQICHIHAPRVDVDILDVVKMPYLRGSIHGQSTLPLPGVVGDIAVFHQALHNNKCWVVKAYLLLGQNSDLRRVDRPGAHRLVDEHFAI